MAILKDLIVHGSSRFLNKIYANEIQTPLIEAEAGIFKKLKANDATVVGLLDVQGQLHTNNWSNSNIATIDGSFYITPTIGSDSGTVAITASSLAFSGTNYAVSSLYLGDGSFITWPQYSKVLVTGQILSNGEWIPLGTLLGQLSAIATATSINVNNIKDNKNQTSSILASLVNDGTTSSSYRNLKISLYQRASSSTAFYPLGIYMTATGTNGRTFLDIYGGVEALSNSNNYGGFAEPNVRIGNLQGLPNVGGQTPSGWGIYTDNGYFKGIIAADKGFIGSGSKYWVIANEEDVSNVENSRSYIYNGKISYNDTTNDGVYLGTDGIGLGKGNFYVTKAGSLTAKSGSIGGWQLDANSFHTGTWGNDNSALICTGTGGSKSIGGSESINNWVFTAGANFGVTKSGALYASSANISGKVVATSGSIGGVNIVDGNLDVSSISIGSLKGAKDFSSDNLLKDVYASSLTKENAQSNRYLSDATNSTITGEFIAEANLPDPNATHFYRITDSSASTKGRALCFYSGVGATPPFIDGHTYRIGCWVRKHDGSPKIQITIGSYGSWMPVHKRIENTEWEWFEIVHTFGETDASKTTQSDTYKKLYIYFYNNNVAGSSLDMCGFRMEEVQTNSGTARNFILGTEKLADWITTQGATISNGVVTFPDVTADTWREACSAKSFKYDLIRNQYVIFSIKVKADSDKKCRFYLNISVDNDETTHIRQKYFDQYIYFTGNGEWQTVCLAVPVFDYMFNSGSGTVDFDDCWTTIRFGAANNYWNGFQVKEPQLCLGTIATSWSRAPEDIDESIDNIEVGGRNLIHNSANFNKWPVQNDGANGDIWYRSLSGRTENANVRPRTWIGTGNLEDYYNKTLTVSFEIMSPDWSAINEGESYTGLNGLAIQLETADGVPYSTIGNTGRYFFKRLGDTNYFKVDSDLVNGKWVKVTSAPLIINDSFWTSSTSLIDGYPTFAFSFLLRRNGTISFRKPKIEIGNKATDWTLAPEDTQENINIIQTNANAINLSPYFSYSPYVVNNYWKNFNDHNGYTFTDMGDGWVRIQYTNTGSSVVRRDFTPKFNREIKEGTDYTWLIEFRNNYSTGTSTGTDFYLVEANNCQFWGGAIKENIEGSGTGSSTYPISYVPTGTSEVYKKRFIKTSEATGSTHWTNGSVESLIGLACFTARCAANTTIDYEVRVSVYEGRYLGDYKPYIDSSAGNVANIALNQSVWYAECPTAAGTAVKVATISPITTDFALTKGVTVNVKFTNTNSATNSSLQLNVNGTGAKNIKYIYNGSYSNIVAGYLKANQMYQFRYDGTYWIVQMMYNTNNYDRSQYAVSLYASQAISSARIAVLGLDGKLHLLDTSSFDISCPLLYVGTAYSATDVTTPTARASNYTYWGASFNLTNTHSIQSAVANTNVYIVGTLSGDIFTPNTTVLTCAEPSTEDGLYYMLLGRMTSTTNAVLQAEHPIYIYKNGAFQRLEATTATSYITQINDTGIKITPSDQSNNNYLQLDANAISMYRANIETLRIDDNNIRIGKVGTNNRNVYITSSAVQIRNNTTVLASYGDSIILGNESSLSQITLSQTGVIFTPKTITNSTESAGTFKYIVNESGYSYTLVEESASNQNTGTATVDPLRLNNNTYYSNTESFSQVILTKVNNEFWVLGKINETETSTVVQSIGTDSETWDYNSTPITKTTITYVTIEETQESIIELEDGSEETEFFVVQVNYQITKVESWEKWSVTSGNISGNYVYSGYIKKDPSDETNQNLYSINYQKKISVSQSSTGTTLNVNMFTDITTSLSFRQMTNFYENKNLDYITTEPDFSILFGKDVWTNSPYSYILGGEKNIIKTNSTVPALYSSIVGGYQNGYFYNKHASTPSLEDTLYKMGIECFIGNGYGNSVQSNLSSIVGGQYNAIYDGESFSVIGGGYNNSIQTWYDDTIPGNTNFYNAPYQFLGGGKDNSSRSDYGVLVGGYNNINLGKYSVISGGASNKTVGQYSVISGGNNNTVLGKNSYTHGYLNIVEGDNQTVLGKANIPDSTSLLIVGNGTSNSNRSNALTLNQSGFLTIKGDLNLYAPRALSLAQASDYSISPSTLMKSNRIYAGIYAGGMNNYYTAQGYHSFYTNGTWTLSIESSKINSTVPLQAPNNIQWISNTNNISRANVIYYGSPNTSDSSSVTANQPGNGWYYYRQFATSSGGYNILLGTYMNTSNPYLFIRSKYKDTSTNTFKWTNWIKFITATYSALTVTRVISTTYITATSFARIKAYKKNEMLYLNFNTFFDGSNYSSTDFTSIATISGWSAISDAYMEIPCQNDSTKIITLFVTSSGNIQVYSTSPIHGWYRANICVPYNT